MPDFPLLIGVDLGTHSLRINVFSMKGKILDSAQGSYPIYKPQPMWAEQNPEDWWQAFCKSILEIYQRGKIDLKRVAVIGVAGQTNGHVLIDEKGEVLDRSIIWMDRRAFIEAEWLQQTFCEADRIRYLGVNLPLDSTTIPARLLWLIKNKPGIMAKAKVTLQPKDYINYKLTGIIATDVVSCKTIINLKTQKLEPEYFSRTKIPLDIFPTIFQPTAIIGVTNGNEELRIPNGISVVAGTIDAWANILGSGVVNPGQAAEVSGSSEVLSVVSERIVYTDRFNVVPSFDHVILNGPTQSGGGSLDWFADIVLGSTNEESISRKELLDKWYKNLKQVPAGSHGVIFLPYLQGERTPIWDSKARGGFIGLNSAHDQLCLVRSILEGVAFNMRHVLDTIEDLGGICVESICISGGGSKNDFWNQIKADVTGKKLRRPLVLDTTSLGAAMLFGFFACGPNSSFLYN
jgi:xylulokinase